MGLSILLKILVPGTAGYVTNNIDNTYLIFRHYFYTIKLLSDCNKCDKGAKEVMY